MFFPTFLQKCGKFFEGAKKEAERCGQAQKKADKKPSQNGQDSPDGGTDRQEVEKPAQKERGGHVQPDPSIAQTEGAGKQDPRGGGPEEKIQQPAYPVRGGQADLPQTVVEQALRRAGGQT